MFGRKDKERSDAAKPNKDTQQTKTRKTKQKQQTEHAGRWAHHEIPRFDRAHTKAHRSGPFGSRPQALCIRFVALCLSVFSWLSVLVRGVRCLTLSCFFFALFDFVLCAFFVVQTRMADEKDGVRKYSIHLWVCSLSDTCAPLPRPCYRLCLWLSGSIR